MANATSVVLNELGIPKSWMSRQKFAFFEDYDVEGVSSVWPSGAA